MITFLDELLDREISLEAVLEEHAGLSEADAAELRRQLQGSKLLAGCEGALRLRCFSFPTSDEMERELPGVADHPDTAKLKARALLRTAEGRGLFDALVREGFERTARNVKMRRGVIVMALVCANFSERVHMEAEAGWPF